MNASDAELLQRYLTGQSEAAFTELAGRHLDLVFSAALRQVGQNVSLAEDVTQAVFTDLARKAPQLKNHPSLTGWLYTSTRFLAANARRTEVRRRTREEQAHAMNELLQSASPELDWEKLHPVLDDALHTLDEADREAVLLRFFERRPLADLGVRFGISAIFDRCTGTSSSPIRSNNRPTVPAFPPGQPAAPRAESPQYESPG